MAVDEAREVLGLLHYKLVQKPPAWLQVDEIVGGEGEHLVVHCLFRQARSVEAGDDGSSRGPQDHVWLYAVFF